MVSQKEKKKEKKKRYFVTLIFYLQFSPSFFLFYLKRLKS